MPCYRPNPNILLVLCNTARTHSNTFTINKMDVKVEMQQPWQWSHFSALLLLLLLILILLLLLLPLLHLLLPCFWSYSYSFSFYCSCSYLSFCYCYCIDAGQGSKMVFKKFVKCSSGGTVRKSTIMKENQICPVFNQIEWNVCKFLVTSRPYHILHQQFVS